MVDARDILSKQRSLGSVIKLPVSLLPVHRGIQRLAQDDTGAHKGPRLPRQALLPPRLGRGLDIALHRRRGQRHDGQHPQVRGQARPGLLPPRRPRRDGDAPDLQAQAGLHARGQGAMGRRHHRERHRARLPRLRPPPLGGREAQPQVLQERRGAVLPAPRRRDTPGIRQAGRKGPLPARQLHLQFRAPAAFGGRRDGRALRQHHQLLRAYAHLRRGDGPGPGLRVVRRFGQAAHGRRRPLQEPALSAARSLLRRSPVALPGRHRPRPLSPRARRPARDASRRRDPPRQAQQPRRSRLGHPPPRRLRPHPLPGLARALHGLRVQPYGQRAPPPPGRAARAPSPKAPSTASSRPPTSTTPSCPSY